MRRPASMPLLSSLWLALLAVGCAPGPEVAGGEPHRIRAHVEFLADDLLEGREAGTRGYDLAARYVASQFAQVGLEPAGDGGSWLQQVPLLRGERMAGDALFAIERNGETIELTFERDYLPGIGYDAEHWGLRAPLVFVGQAVVAPEFDHDDLAGVDVQGKIAVVLAGAPARFGNAPRALYASTREKLRVLSERGVVGVVFARDPDRERRSPWARGAANWRRPGMRLRDADGRPLDTFPQIRASASLSLEATRVLLADAPQSPDEVFQRLRDGTLQAFDLAGRARLVGRSRLTPLDSANVVGLLPGTDAALAHEHIVYTAHLDHVGIGAPVAGDAIYNGALDNALGVGVLVETARLAAAAPRTARSQLFVALTAEEKGLLGAEHFAAGFAGSRGVDGELVANVNMDMPVMLGPQRDVVPIGIEHSSLQSVVESAAAELGIGLTPDPFPEEVVFVRSDQFAFVRRGIPAVYIDGGIDVDADDSGAPGGDGRAQLEGFLRQHYHQPSDDTTLPIHYPSAARLATLNQRLGARIGDATERPRWNRGDLFGERYGREPRP